MTVSVVIPVFKRITWLERCLEALAKQDLKDEFEVVIVDDGSPNRTAIEQLIGGWLQRSTVFRLAFYRKSNGGPAAARNFGVRKTGGAILCFLDDDSIPHCSWLREIVDFFSKKDVGLLSGQTCSYDRESALPLLLEKTVYEGKCFATCNIAYRRTVFEALGGFDEGFRYASWEDNDLGWRARWAGYSHLYNSKAIVYHPHEATLKEYREKCRLNGRGAAFFSRKYLLSKPWWALITPLAMARRLPCGLILPFLFRQGVTKSQVKFLWSYHSIIGFIQAIFAESRNA